MPPVDQGPRLAAGRYRVRPPAVTDLDGIIKAAQDETVVRWSNMPVPYFRNHAQAWLEAHAYRPENAQSWWANPTWSVIDPQDTWCASIELRTDGTGAADLAFLTTQFDSPGLTEAIRAVCAWAFATLGVQVIRWTGPVGNQQAIEVMQRSRFRIHQDIARRGYSQRGVRVNAITADLIPDDLEPNTQELRLSDLTEREHEVLVELAAGRSNREIANVLQISENTVKNHVRSILEKLQAVSRVEAVVIGVQRGLVRVPSA